ncbi:uncharacterized protein LOC117105047 [Anneissia japonica]|uniref:uncharacterized protein LOC117105047 n=1 Tax=Anneissia japonica TaxID=1529436 RepID=UPI0014255311|nr:uncharacterized protein LOC117105047 [Anneissia japonica]
MFPVQIHKSEFLLQTGAQYQLHTDKNKLSLKRPSSAKTLISWRWDTIRNHSVYQQYYSIEMYDATLSKTCSLTLTSCNAGAIYKAVQENILVFSTKVCKNLKNLQAECKSDSPGTGIEIQPQDIPKDLLYENLKINKKYENISSQFDVNNYEGQEKSNQEIRIKSSSEIPTITLTTEKLQNSNNIINCVEQAITTPKRKNRGRPYKEVVQLVMNQTQKITSPQSESKYCQGQENDNQENCVKQVIANPRRKNRDQPYKEMVQILTVQN